MVEQNYAEISVGSLKETKEKISRFITRTIDVYQLQLTHRLDLVAEVKKFSRTYKPLTIPTIARSFTEFIKEARTKKFIIYNGESAASIKRAGRYLLIGGLVLEDLSLSKIDKLRKELIKLGLEEITENAC